MAPSTPDATDADLAKKRRKSSPAVLAKQEERCKAAHDSLEVLKARLQAMEDGKVSKGRAAQQDLRNWGTDLMTARKAARAVSDSTSEAAELKVAIEKMDAAINFLRVYCKNVPSPIELDKVHKAGVDAGVVFNVGMTKAVTLGRMKALVSEESFEEAVGNMAGLCTGSEENVEAALLEAVAIIFKPLWPSKGEVNVTQAEKALAAMQRLQPMPSMLQGDLACILGLQNPGVDMKILKDHLETAKVVSSGLGKRNCLLAIFLKSSMGQAARKQAGIELAKLASLDVARDGLQRVTKNISEMKNDKYTDPEACLKSMTKLVGEAIHAATAPGAQELELEHSLHHEVEQVIRHVVALALSGWAKEVGNFDAKAFESAKFHLQFVDVWDSWHRRDKWAIARCVAPDDIDAQFVSLGFVKQVHNLSQSAWLGFGADADAGQKQRACVIFIGQAMAVMESWDAHWKGAMEALTLDMSVAGVKDTMLIKIRDTCDELVRDLGAGRDPGVPVTVVPGLSHLNDVWATSGDLKAEAQDSAALLMKEDFDRRGTVERLDMDIGLAKVLGRVASVGEVKQAWADTVVQLSSFAAAFQSFVAVSNCFMACSALEKGELGHLPDAELNQLRAEFLQYFSALVKEAGAIDVDVAPAQYIAGLKLHIEGLAKRGLIIKESCKAECNVFVASIKENSLNHSILQGIGKAC